MGPERPVSEYSDSPAYSPAVARDTNGNSMVVWSCLNRDGSDGGIFMRRFGPDGIPLGSEVQVNTYTAGSQSYPDVAMDDAGNAVVVWHSHNQNGDNGYNIYMQRYTASGATVGGETLVNTTTNGNQKLPCVAMDADGDFAVAWEADNLPGGSITDIGMTLFDETGASVTGEVLVNDYTTSGQLHPAIDMRYDGTFAIVWESMGKDGSGRGICAHLFRHTGAKYQSEFNVNTNTVWDQQAPDVAYAPNGRYMVTWHDPLMDGDELGVRARLYDTNTNALTGEIAVNVYTNGDQRNPRITADSKSSYHIAWESYGNEIGPIEATNPDCGIFGRRFDSDGNAVGTSEIQVNEWIERAQYDPAITVRNNGKIAVVWVGDGQQGCNLVVDKRGPVHPVLPGADAEYTLVVSNAGPITADAVILTDTPPSNATVEAMSSGGALNGNGGISWTLGDMAPGASAQRDITLRMPSCRGPRVLLSCERNAFDGMLHLLDPVTFRTRSSTMVTVSNTVVEQVRTLALHPHTGDVYAMVTQSGMSTFDLVRLNPFTGDTDYIGNCSNKVSGMAFDSTGVLWGVTPNSNGNPAGDESLCTISLSNAVMTMVLTELAGGDGDDLGFCPDDGMLYHVSGYNDPRNDPEDGEIMETIDPTTFTTTQVTLTGHDYNGCIGLCDDGDGSLLAVDRDGDLCRITTGGVISLVTNLDHSSSDILLMRGYANIAEASATTEDILPANDRDVVVTHVSTDVTGLAPEGEGTRLTWHSESGLVYRVQTATNLLDACWVDTGTDLPAVGGTMSVVFTNAPVPFRAYRFNMNPANP
ncbi:MAG: DUF11 domain-containing protein [Verrucomicrobia bacterium]|nr:DUF11 domain-containing protein [Verrucomicrobiota bacterium]